MLKRVGWGKQREATASIQSLVKLQPWFLSLRWKTYLRQNCSLGSCACSEIPALAQNTNDDGDGDASGDGDGGDCDGDGGDGDGGDGDGDGDGGDGDGGDDDGSGGEWAVM